jgi:hypothetical protein
MSALAMAQEQVGLWRAEAEWCGFESLRRPHLYSEGDAAALEVGDECLSVDPSLAADKLPQHSRLGLVNGPGHESAE